MPMMLDNSMGVDLQDVDELFEDTVGLGIPMRAPPKDLQYRMEDLKRRGCAQYVVKSSATPRTVVVLTYVSGLWRGRGWELSLPSHLMGCPFS